MNVSKSFGIHLKQSWKSKCHWESRVFISRTYLIEMKYVIQEIKYHMLFKMSIISTQAAEETFGVNWTVRRTFGLSNNIASVGPKDIDCWRFKGSTWRRWSRWWWYRWIYFRQHRTLADCHHILFHLWRCCLAIVTNRAQHNQTDDRNLEI